MVATASVQDLLDQVERIRPIIEQHRDEAEIQRYLSREVHDAMFEAGLFAMQAPKAYGGLEYHPIDLLKVLEAVARIDSAAAWNLSMNQSVAAYGAWLPAEGAKEIFGNGVTTMAGALFPPAAAKRADGGWRVSGQVPFGSGCHNVEWLAMPAWEMDGDEPKIDPETGEPSPFGIMFPSSEATILDTWHTLGMRGSGSTDFEVNDVFVPDHRTVPVGPLTNPAPGFEGPTYRMWPWIPIFGEAIVSVGVAAAAVDDAIELAKTKTAAYNVAPLKEQQLAHYQIGKAKARVDAARDTMYRAIDEGYEQVDRDVSTLSIESKIRLQLAATFAAEASAEAVRWVNDLVGTSSIRQGQRFERYFRDTHTLVQHTSKSNNRYASAGRIMFGVETDWVWLTF